MTHFSEEVCRSPILIILLIRFYVCNSIDLICCSDVCNYDAAEKNLGRCMLDCGGKRIEQGYTNNTCNWHTYLLLVFSTFGGVSLLFVLKY